MSRNVLMALAVLFFCGQYIPVSFAQATVTGRRTYAGANLEVWHQRMKAIDPKSSSAASMVDPLIAIIRDETLPGVDREPFAAYLARVGRPAEKAVPILASMIYRRHENEDTDYRWASRALALMGTPASDATPALVELLFDDQLPVSHRQSAIEAIALIGSAHPDAIPALLRLLRRQPTAGDSADDARTMRFLAAESIFIAAPEAAELAAPLLIRMIRDPHESQQTRRSAIMGLGSLKAGGEVAVPVLLEELVTGRVPALRDAAADSLGRLGKPAVESIRRCCAHSDPGVRWRVAFSSRALEDADAIKGDLLKLLDDPQAIVRINAAETAEKLWGRSGDVARVAILLLREDDRSIRLRAKNLLVAMKPLEPENLKHLRQLSRDKKRRTAMSARVTLAQLRKKD